MVGQISVPLFDGGATTSQVRQAKETFGQRQLEADATWDAIRRAVATNWGQVHSARQQIRSAQDQVRAARTAVAADLEQVRFGQRTVLEALNDQREALNAETNLVVAKHDHIVSAFGLLHALGTLRIEEFGTGPTTLAAQARPSMRNVASLFYKSKTRVGLRTSSGGLDCGVFCEAGFSEWSLRAERN